jgi:hypothetical protein
METSIMNIIYKSLSVLTVLLLTSMSISHADQAPLVKDAYVDGTSSQANKNKGTKPVLWVESINPKYGLVQFDLSAFGGTVSSATLVLNVSVVDVPGDITLHALQSSWIETNVTFNTTPFFDPIETATLAVTGADVGGTVSIDITSLAQFWVDSPDNNFGILLLTTAGDVRFASTETALGATLEVVTDGGSPPPPPPPIGAAISLSSVYADMDNGMLYIYGSNFDNGNPAVVNLGEMGELDQLTPSSATAIEAELPAGLLAGDYSLLVSTGPNDGQLIGYDLTIGATGATGATGADGAAGANGSDGVDGAAGANGSDGADGAAGANGSDGVDGAAGANGADGLPGLSGFEFKLLSFGRDNIGVNDGMIVNVTCPPGKTAISGAYTLQYYLTSPQVYAKFLLVTSQRNGANAWQFNWRNIDTVPHNFYGIARVGCAIVQ